MTVIRRRAPERPKDRPPPIGHKPPKGNPPNTGPKDTRPPDKGKPGK